MIHRLTKSVALLLLLILNIFMFNINSDFAVKLVEIVIHAIDENQLHTLRRRR